MTPEPLCSHVFIRRKAGGTCPICEPLTSRSIDPAIAMARLKSIRACNAKERLSDFVRQGWHVLHPTVPLDWNWHLDVLCEHVEAAGYELLRARREPDYKMQVQNLLINIPPRQLKTEVLQIFFPAWLWIHDPSLIIRCLSGNQTVITLAAQACRLLIGSQWYLDSFRVPWTITGDADAVGLCRNTMLGQRLAGTFLADITGTGSDVLLVDDPHDAQSVNSEVMRQRVINKWDLAIGNRVMNTQRCLRVGIMQRLNEGDWSAHVLQQGWRHLRLPMQFESKVDCKCSDCTTGQTFLGWSDPRSEDGELLHPERWPLDKVEEERVRLGPYGFAGQLQQRPAPIEGGLFKRAWFKEYDPDNLPRFDDVLVSCDLANSEHALKHGSRNSLVVFGKKGNLRYVLDELNGRWSMTDIKRNIILLQEKWQTLAKVRTVRVLVEKKAAGNFVIAALKNEMGVMGVVEDDEAQAAHNDKMVRAQAVEPQVAGGAVMLPKGGASWVEEFLHEVCTFPVGSHDDRVDAMTMALNFWRTPDALRTFCGTAKM